MSEETNKSDGNGSDEIDIFLTDSYCDKKYMTQIPKNATVKDLVKKVKDFGLECFDPKYDRKYFSLVHGLTMITTSANIGKTTADLGIEEGSNIHVVPRDRLIEENQDGFIEIKKLETEKESEETNKSDGNGSDEIDIFLTDSYRDKTYMTQIPKNATVKDLVKKVKDFGPECFDPKYNKKYFALVHESTMITNSANIGKTTADLGIEEGSNIRVVPRDRLIEENQDGFIEIKKLETEKESEKACENESQVSKNSSVSNQETKNMPHTASRTENLLDRVENHRSSNLKPKHEEDSINTDINRQG